MSPEGSGTTSTDRERMVERQLRRRGIEDERVMDAMAEVPRELFVPENRRRRAYRDGALPIGEGQTMSQPWIVACMIQLLELGGRARARGGHRLGLRRRGAVAALPHVVTIERFDSLAARRRALDELGYDNVEVRVGDGARGAPDRAPFDGISVTAAARASRRARSSTSSRREPPRLPGRARRGRAPDPLPRRARGDGHRRSLRAAREAVIREFSAGGVVIRNFTAARTWRSCACARRSSRCRRATPSRASR